jgi:hypothetical protein
MADVIELIQADHQRICALLDALDALRRDRGARSPRTVALRPGEQILFYTDGISEARNKSGEFYPLERSGPLLDGQPPDTALDRLYRDVLRYVGHILNDDATMLLISRRPAMGKSAPG